MAQSLNSTASRVIPAQVNFLTIYNPLLGDTDETEQDQIVFWASKDDLLRTHRSTRSRENHTRDGTTSEHDQVKQKPDDVETGNRLRQIGLARGMLEFANNFTDNQPVSSIDTEKSRIILHELENGWWILASIDLTKLPAANTTSNSKNTLGANKEHDAQHEYSAREVAPTQLLLAQILRAHRIFLLHHAVNLWDIYHRVGRPNFCALLDKYWGKFVWEWDVLLHGSPAVDIYGCCTKLAGGGELGIGVGEEEWGSGEREVLEGFVERTEGLVDMVVGRYGLAPVKKDRDQTGDVGNTGTAHWLNSGEDSGPADGVVFSGTGTITRKSLATISQWMEAIFKHGHGAYGIGENPSARPRQKRKTHSRPTPIRNVSDEHLTNENKSGGDGTQKLRKEVHPRYRSPRGQAPSLRKQAIENSAAPPGIPAPLVGSVESSLDAAVARAADRPTSRSPKNSPNQEKTQEEAMKTDGPDKNANGDSDDAATSSIFGADKMMKVLTLGYGSSWTLNPKGWQDQNSVSKDDGKQKGDNDKASPGQSVLSQKDSRKPELSDSLQKSSKPAEERLQELDPTPAVSDDDDAKPFVQRLKKAVGKFLIGFPGDLEDTDFDEDEIMASENDSSRENHPPRIHLRILSLEVTKARQRPTFASAGRTVSQDSYSSDRGEGNERAASKPRTSAGASIDGPAPRESYPEKLQVAVYLHQPFIFVFLFELHTPTLTIPSFYRNIHHQLGPLQGPLLKRTDPNRVAERIKDVIMSKDSSVSASMLQKTAAIGNVVFDLIYDPEKLTVRTSLPNIPIPAPSVQETNTNTKSITVSGSWYTLGIPISSPASLPSLAHTTGQSTFDGSLRNKVADHWTRVDALNVHGQLLNTWIATRPTFSNAASNTNANVSCQASTSEIERTVKTSRGWWVLWMKISGHSQTNVEPSSTSVSSTRTISGRQNKEAFLIRKATDYAPTGKITTSRSGSSGRWLLKEQNRDTSRTSHSSGNDAAGTGARSISEGVGIDAQKWVEGLLHLSQ